MKDKINISYDDLAKVMASAIWGVSLHSDNPISEAKIIKIKAALLSDLKLPNSVENMVDLYNEHIAE